ncbi:hypothetical protein [Streptomyces sp. NPDC001494]
MSSAVICAESSPAAGLRAVRQLEERQRAAHRVVGPLVERQ